MSEELRCAKPFCGRLLDPGQTWPQVDLNDEPSRVFCDVKCLSTWAHEHVTHGPVTPVEHALAATDADLADCRAALAAALEREAAAARERDAVLAKVERVVENAVSALMGRCKSDHGSLSFDEFLEAGGHSCPICLQAERDRYREKFNAQIAYVGEAAERLVDARAAHRAAVEALPCPVKLWALAAWLDIKYPDDPNPEVQRDLRAWARKIMAIKMPDMDIEAFCAEIADGSGVCTCGDGLHGEDAALATTPEPVAADTLPPIPPLATYRAQAAVSSVQEAVPGPIDDEPVAVAPRDSEERQA